MNKIRTMRNDVNTDIEYDLKVLSLESNVMSNMINNLKDIIIKLSSNLKTNSDKLEIIKSGVLKKDFLTLDNELNLKNNERNFLDYSRTLVQVPEGFIGNLNDYVVTLAIVQKELFTDIDNFSNEYKDLLADFITNKDCRKASGSQLKLLNNIKEKFENYAATTTVGYFDLESNVSRLPLGKAVSSFNSLRELTKNSIKLNNSYADMELEYLTGTIDSLNELLGDIHDLILKGKIEDSSSSITLDISNGAFELARLIELFSVVRFKVKTILETIPAIYSFLISLD